MGIKDELKRMTGALFGNRDTSDNDDTTTETPTTELQSTDAPTTDIPSDDTSTDAPSTSVPTTEVPDELASLRAELELLKAEKNKTPEPTKAPSTDAPIADEDFMAGIDFDDVTRDASSFNTLLNKVFKKGVESARKELKSGSAGVLNSVPGMVRENLDTIQKLEKISTEFYSTNEDLKDFKQVVSTVFGEVAAANPDKSYIEALNLTGDEVRKRLKLTKPTEKSKPPRLPKAKGSQRSKPTESTKGISSEIDAMNKALNL